MYIVTRYFSITIRSAVCSGSVMRGSSVCIRLARNEDDAEQGDHQYAEVCHLFHDCGFKVEFKDTPDQRVSLYSFTR